MCGEDLVFGGLCCDAGLSGLSGPGPGDLLPPADAHVCATLCQYGQPCAQPLCTSSMHLTLKIILNNRHSKHIYLNRFLINYIQ